MNEQKIIKFCPEIINKGQRKGQPCGRLVSKPEENKICYYHRVVLPKLKKLQEEKKKKRGERKKQKQEEKKKQREELEKQREEEKKKRRIEILEDVETLYERVRKFESIPYLKKVLRDNLDVIEELFTEHFTEEERIKSKLLLVESKNDVKLLDDYIRNRNQLINKGFIEIKKQIFYTPMLIYLKELAEKKPKLKHYYKYIELNLPDFCSKGEILEKLRIIRRRFGLIGTHTMLKRKKSVIIDIHNYIDNPLDIVKLMNKIFSEQKFSFKMDIRYGWIRQYRISGNPEEREEKLTIKMPEDMHILKRVRDDEKEEDTGVWIYDFLSSKNSKSIIHPKDTLIQNKQDMENIIERMLDFDKCIEHGAIGVGSMTKIIGIYQIGIMIFPTTFNIGEKLEIPQHLKKSDFTRNPITRENHCFWGCLAMFLNKKVLSKRCTKIGEELYAKYGQDLSASGNIMIENIPILEKRLQICIEIYTIDEDLTATLYL